MLLFILRNRSIYLLLMLRTRSIYLLLMLRTGLIYLLLFLRIRSISVSSEYFLIRLLTNNNISLTNINRKQKSNQNFTKTEK